MYGQNLSLDASDEIVCCVSYCPCCRHMVKLSYHHDEMHFDNSEDCGTR